MMRYLVLGSAGQIGGHLVPYLKTMGHDVATFDVVDNPQEDLRIMDNQLLNDKIRECDFVFFLAFDVGGSKYLSKYQNTFEFLSNNSRLMDFTFSLLKKHNKPFIFASSQMSNMDWSGYGSAKRIGEHYSRSLGGLIVKFWNVYGVEKDEEKSHVITDFVKMAIKNKRIDMLTDGSESRQFLYADDCCECLHNLSCVYHQLDKSKNYHITSFNWTTILDVAKIVSSVVSCDIVPSRDKDMVHMSLKNEADTHVLQYWKPKTNLKRGIELICDHFRSLV